MDGCIYQNVLFCAFTHNDPNCSVCARDAELGTVVMTYRGGFVHIIIVGKGYILGAEEFKPIIYVWALNKKDPKLRIACRGVISSMVLSPSENYLLASVEEKIYIWMLPSGSLNVVLSNHISRITCLKFSLAGPTFISADEHGYIAVWSLPKILSRPAQYTHAPSLQFTRHSSKITCVALTRNLAITASTDCTLKIWDLTTGEVQQDILFDVPCSSLALSHALGSHIFAGLMDGHVKKILKNGYIFEDFKVLTGSPVCCLQISNDGNLVSTSVDGEIKILQIETGLCQKTLHFKSKLSCTFIKELPMRWAESSHSKSVNELFPVLKFELASKEEREFVTVNFEGRKSLWSDDDGGNGNENASNLSATESCPPSNDIWTTKNLNRNLYNFMVERILSQ